MKENEVRELSGLEAAISESLPAFPALGCPEPEQLEEAFSRKSRSVGYDEIMRHVASCSSCLATMRLLARANRAKESAGSKWTELFENTPIRFGEQLQEAGTNLPSWITRFLKSFAKTPVYAGAYRSTPPGSGIMKITAPNVENRLVLDKLESFEWLPVSGATGYVIALEEIRPKATKGCFAVVSEKLGTNQSSWALEKRLRAGKQYRLKIRPDFDDPDLRAAVTETLVVFCTPSRAQREQAEWAVDSRNHTPLSSAIVLYELGLFKEALEAIRLWEDETARGTWERRITEAIEARKADASV